MDISSRTPEGEDNRCTVCGHALRLEPTRPPGDAPCPFCGVLLWFPDIHGGELEPLLAPRRSKKDFPSPLPAKVRESAHNESEVVLQQNGLVFVSTASLLSVLLLAVMWPLVIALFLRLLFAGWPGSYQSWGALAGLFLAGFFLLRLRRSVRTRYLGRKLAMTVGQAVLVTGVIILVGAAITVCAPWTVK
jgi:hypothetical protein